MTLRACSVRILRVIFKSNEQREINRENLLKLCAEILKPQTKMRKKEEKKGKEKNHTHEFIVEQVAGLHQRVH